MNKRGTILQRMRVAGYHEDTATYVRITCESRISRAVLDHAWAGGADAKARGVPCGCSDCKSARVAALAKKGSKT